MRNKTNIVAAFVLSCVAYLWSCDDDDSSQIGALCDRMTECGATNSSDDCNTTFEILVLSSECLDAMIAAPCEDHLKDDSSKTSYADVCFEPCQTTEQRCVADTIIGCESGVELVVDCARSCSLIKKEDYTGTCGALGPSGQTSEQPVCWCE